MNRFPAKKTFPVTAPLLLLLLFSARVEALDFWRHPETAGVNTLFLSVRYTGLSVTGGFTWDTSAVPLQFVADWMFPFPLPFSLGAFLAVPSPNLKHFGPRLGYHINLDVPNLDLFFLYVSDFGWVRNDLLAEYGDTPVEPLRYDFRAGVRWAFSRFVCLEIESDFRLRSVNIGIAAKLF